MTVVDIAAFRTLPCTFCLCDVPRRDMDRHLAECQARRSRMSHPSNRGRGDG